MDRYRLQGWLNFIGNELQKSCGTLFNPGASGDSKVAARANLARRLAYVDEQLVGRDYLVGDAFSVADGYLFTALRWMTPLGIDLSERQRIQAFQERIGARPAVCAALLAEGLV